jgi:hypothetical protein
MTFITAWNSNARSPNASPNTDQDASLVQIEENVCIQVKRIHSIVNIPKRISDADAMML